MATERMRILVSGRVQGVGYRYFAQREAQRLGLTGWVRNLPSGQVQAEAQGEPAVLATFLATLRAGPPLGHVTELVSQPVGVHADDTGFAITY
jgi:acylphosphatase